MGGQEGLIELTIRGLRSAASPVRRVESRWWPGPRHPRDALHLDRYDNTTIQRVNRDHERSRVRLPGSGGAAAIAAHARHTLIVSKLNLQAFPERVDFTTSPGQRCYGAARSANWGCPGAGLPR